MDHRGSVLLERIDLHGFIFVAKRLRKKNTVEKRLPLVSYSEAR